MKKVIIIGSPGSGKSTFARNLKDKSGLPLYHLDMIYHKSDRSHVSRDEFDKKLSEILEKNEWIIDGNYERTMDRRMEECDTVFFLDFPTEVCLQGAKDRVGKPRGDCPFIENELDPEFEKEILEFRERNIERIYSRLEKFQSDRDVIIFKSREEIEEYMKK